MYEDFVCPLCRQTRPGTDAILGETVRPSVRALVTAAYPGWSGTGAVCGSCIRRFRAEFVEDLLEQERGDLTGVEREVVQSLKAQELVTRNINIDFAKRITFGETVADRVAAFGGSWRFIIIFGGILIIWIVVNVILVHYASDWDPYPFILLNLVLSCLAALQAPVIMMSQNRQQEKDRVRAEHDYRVNLKAELEIRHLNLKMDQLLTHQWRHLLEIQQIQMELMEEVLRGRAQGS